MRHFKIFLASPSDTSKERMLTQEVVNEINKSAGKDEYTIELFLWEENTFSSIGADGQDVINNQNFDYDIFIGIMSHKFGFPTPRALSATAEEYEIALKKYKEDNLKNIMFYFNSSDLPYDIDTEQFNKVKEFKKKIQNDGVFTKTYDKKTGFDKILRTELILSIKNILKKESATIVDKIKNPVNFIPEIKKSFIDFLNDMEATFAHPNKDKIFLEDIYVSPDLQKLEKNSKSNVNKTIKLSVLSDAIDLEGIKYVFLGEELAGKTASIKYIFQKYFDQNLIPIDVKVFNSILDLTENI